MIITKTSHLDHGLTPAHVAWIAAHFADRSGFFIETIELPADLPTIGCALHGPTMGDAPISDADVSHVIRGNRSCASRVASLPIRQTRKLTVIAGPSGEEPCLLYTSYGGPPAPREPGDLSLATWEQIQESRIFWATHALAR